LYKILKNQWETPEQLKKIQTIKLKKLIRHAYEKVPYYRKLFDSLKIKPEDIKEIEDLKLLPLTSKEQLQEASLKEKIAEDIDVRTCKYLSTSGTTGVPLKMFFTYRDSTLMNFSWARAYLASGMKPWYKMIAFVGQKRVKEKKSWYEHIGLWQRKEISLWDKPDYWVKEIQDWKPEVLTGNVMILKLLEDFVHQNQIRDISPEIIFHSSTLLDDFSRQSFRSTFLSKIEDIYGSDEAGCIAWECDKCKGYHICSDMVIVEVLKDKKSVSPGEQGEVVITNLHSYAMPFIRYKQEDVVSLSKEKAVCGRGFPLLEDIKGRTDDFVILKNGQRIPPQPFYHCIIHVPGVKRWRIIQENVNKLKVEIEHEIDFNRNARQRIENNIKKLVKNKIDIEISCVDSIPINPSSKFRSVSSKIKRSFL